MYHIDKTLKTGRQTGDIMMTMRRSTTG